MIPVKSLTDFLKNVCRFWWKTILDFYNAHGFIRSASLAYTTLLAIAPLSIIIISLVSFFPIFNRVIHQLENFIFKNFVPHTGDQVLKALERFQQHAHHLPWLSFIFMFFTAMMVLTTMESHLNELWGVSVKRSRSFGLSLLIHWAILTIGPILLCSSLFLSSLVLSNKWIALLPFSQLAVILPITCSFLAYMFLYVTLPCCKVKFAHAALGAFFAAIAFEAAKIGFGVYTTMMPTYSLVYGTLAVIPLFLLWLYLASVIFLLGSQVVNTLRLRYESAQARKEAILSQA